MLAIVKSTGSVTSTAAILVRGTLPVVILLSALAIAFNGGLDGPAEAPAEGDASPGAATARPEATNTLEATATPDVITQPEAAVTPEAETPTATARPFPETVTCAAGSTDGFLEAADGADFAIYCPTFLPAGLALQELAFYPIGAIPPMDAPQPGELNASFVSSDFQTQVVLYEGHLGHPS